MEVFNKGLVFAMSSALMFSVMNAFVKELSRTMGTGEIVFVRSLIGVIVILLVMKKCRISFSHHDIPALVFRGVAGGVSMYLWFYSMRGLPLADASILQQLSAFFVLLISIFYLKDKMPRSAIAPLCAIVLGACFVLRPWDYNSFSVYAVYAIISSFLVAAVYTTIHKLFDKGGHSSWEIVFYFLFFSTLIGAVTMIGSVKMPTTYEAVLLVAVGITSLLAQEFMTKGFEYANQVLVSFIMYMGIFLNALWGYVFFGEIMSLLSLIGGIFIIAGSLYLTIERRKKRS